MRVWARVGLLSFGGPAGQVAVMHRILVEERRWIGESAFLNGLNFCMLLPGPEAQQLATYIGWRLHGTAGGLVAGVLFVLPGFLVMLGLSFLYVAFRDTAVLGGLFFGLKSAVFVIVLEAVARIGRRALGSRAAVVVAVAGFLCISILTVPFPALIAAAGVVGFLSGPQGVGDSASPSTETGLGRSLRTLGLWMCVWWLPVLFLVVGLGDGHVFAKLALFFSKVAVVTFGGAYAVLSYVAEEAVHTFAWMAPGEMQDGLGLAETTPGPLIIVVQFVAFLAAFREPFGMSPYVSGTMGALVVTWVTYAPCFLWIFVGAPYVEWLRGRARIRAALSYIAAAVVGVIGNLALWFALHTFFGGQTRVTWAFVSFHVPVWSDVSWPALVLATAAAVATFRWRWGMAPVLAATAALGLAWKLAQGALG